SGLGMDSNDSTLTSVSEFESVISAGPMIAALRNGRSGAPTLQDPSKSGRDINAMLTKWENDGCLPVRWKEYVCFNPQYNRTPGELNRSRVQYESLCRRKRELELRPFQIYGTPELYEYDLLKCWVQFQLWRLHEDRWPPGYTRLDEDLAFSDGPSVASLF
ncbi:MAG: hypothetical protein LQ338_007167, partial [Usnochroma carphineum]